MKRLAFFLVVTFASGCPAIGEVLTAQADGALLRTLDKVSGEVVDQIILKNSNIRVGNLEVTVNECRYPVDNPVGDAFARMTIQSEKFVTPVFQGWMVASSPALSSLDHARYDVWVLRCTMSSDVTE